MRLESIALQNFGPYADVELDLRHGSSFSVSGPNGSGKSTLCSDGVLWALFGKCRADTDAFIRLGETDMSSTIIFTANGQRYRATRTRSIRTKKGKSDHQLTVQNGSDWIPVDRAIEKILNADYDIVTASNFITQDDPFDLCKAKPSDRIKLLSGILDIDKYTDYAKRATRQGNLSEGELTSLVGQVEEKRQAVETYRKAVTQLETVECQLQTLTAQIEQAQVDLDQAIIEKARLEASIQAMPEEDIGYLETQVSMLVMTRDRLQAKLKELEEWAAKEPELLRQQALLEKDVAELPALKQQRESLDQEYRQADEDIQYVQDRLAAIRTQQSDLKIQQAAVEVELTGLRERIQEFEAVLAQDDDRAETVAKLQETELAKTQHDRDLAAAVAKMDATQRQYEQKRTALQDVKDQLAHATAKRDQAATLIEQWVDQYQRETMQLIKKIDAASQQVRLLEDVPCDAGLQRKCKFVSSALVAKEEELPALHQELRDRPTEDAQIRPLAPYDRIGPDRAVDTLTHAVRDLEQSLTVVAQDTHVCRESITHLQGLIDNLESGLATLRGSLPDAAYLTKAHSELPGFQQKALAKEQEISGLQLQLGTILSSIQTHTFSLEEMKTARLNIQAGIRRHEQSCAAAEASITLIRATVTDLPKVQHAKEALPDMQRDWETKLAELATAQQALEHARTHAERKQALSQQLTEITEHYASRQLALAEYQGQCQVCVEHRAQAKATIAQTCKAEAELQTIEKRVGELKSAVQEYSWLAEAYKRVPVLMIDNAIPVVEREANRALQQLSARAMTLRFETQKALKTVDKLVDELNIIVRDQIGERSYESYSGGERGLANFSTRLGLSALTSTRSGARIETMTIDEAFASLDESVSERMRAFLGTLPEKFPLVLVITHDQNFKGTLGSQIVVSPGPNGSTVEVG